MKKQVYLLACFLSLVLSGAANAAGWTGNFNAYFGGKALNDSDWRADEHTEIGARLDFKKEGWPLSIAADTHFSNGDDKGFVRGTGVVDEDVDTCEFNLGLRKYWDGASNIHPFLGGGVAYAQLEAKQKIDGVTRLSDKGNGIGVWVNGGILWTLNAFNIGFDLRYTRVEIGLDDGDSEGGGSHAGILLGYNW